MRERLSEERQTKEELNKQLEIEREKRAEAEELVARLQERKPVVIASGRLSPTVFERGGSPKTVTLKAGTKRVYLRLQLDDGQRYSRYSVLLTTFDGRRVWGEESLDAGRVRNGRLTLPLPPSVLEYEDYRIELRGLSDNGESVHVADYVFKVRESNRLTLLSTGTTHSTERNFKPPEISPTLRHLYVRALRVGCLEVRYDTHSVSGGGPKRVSVTSSRRGDTDDRGVHPPVRHARPV